MEEERDETGIQTLVVQPQKPPSILDQARFQEKTSPKCTVLHPKALFQWVDSLSPLPKFRSSAPPWSHPLLFLQVGMCKERRGLTQEGMRCLRKSWYSRSRCSWLLTSICPSSFSTNSPLNKIASRLQMSSRALGAGTCASCWQLSFLWGHQLTHSTLLLFCPPYCPASFGWLLLVTTT